MSDSDEEHVVPDLGQELEDEGDESSEVLDDFVPVPQAPSFLSEVSAEQLRGQQRNSSAGVSEASFEPLENLLQPPQGPSHERTRVRRRHPAGDGTRVTEATLPLLTQSSSQDVSHQAPEISEEQLRTALRGRRRLHAAEGSRVSQATLPPLRQPSQGSSRISRLFSPPREIREERRPQDDPRVVRPRARRLETSFSIQPGSPPSSQVEPSIPIQPGSPSSSEPEPSFFSQIGPSSLYSTSGFELCLRTPATQSRFSEPGPSTSSQPGAFSQFSPSRSQSSSRTSHSRSPTFELGLHGDVESQLSVDHPESQLDITPIAPPNLDQPWEERLISYHEEELNHEDLEEEDED